MVVLVATLALLGSAAGVATLATAAPAGPAPPSTDTTVTVATERLRLADDGQICAERGPGERNLVAIHDATFRNLTVFSDARAYRLRAGDPGARLEGTLLLETTGANPRMDALAAAGECIPLDQHRPVVLEAYGLSFAEIQASGFLLTTGDGAGNGAPAPGGLRLGDALAPAPQRNASGVPAGGPVPASVNGSAPVDSPPSGVPNGTVGDGSLDGRPAVVDTVTNATGANTTVTNETVEAVPRPNVTAVRDVAANATDENGTVADGVAAVNDTADNVSTPPEASRGPVETAADAVSEVVDETTDALTAAAGVGGDNDPAAATETDPPANTSESPATRPGSPLDVIGGAPGWVSEAGRPPTLAA